ncbi:hypothetical protein [Virgisporangium aurantiacum]|uniref:Uncharacterized protein n=1 Tax=Virgisporangium aurantiacum TaxID=175570 RepID=A0A8J4E7B6_9ACTN|nr:hypothetical protein [Virgisporangium aurantiacum]GIJ64119.1 hypothetical protein Vau01_116350 [Virgisporangium aurantiacum]
MGELLTVLLAILCAGFGLVLVKVMVQSRSAAGATGLLVVGGILVVLVLATPISYERIDAHDLLNCGSVLDPIGWKPSGLPGDRATECGRAYRRRTIWAAAVAGLTVVSVGVMVLRGRRVAAR